jgi:hypothetical protein
VEGRKAAFENLFCLLKPNVLNAMPNKKRSADLDTLKVGALSAFSPECMPQVRPNAALSGMARSTLSLAALKNMRLKLPPMLAKIKRI